MRRSSARCAAFLAAEAVDSSKHLRKAFDVAALYQRVRRHGRWKAEDLWCADRAGTADHGIERIDHGIELCAADIDTVDTGRNQETTGEQIIEPWGCDIHGQNPPDVGLCISSKLPVLSSIRSLLIMIGADSRSRICRPRLNGEPFR